jgi:hypothetical protein
VDEELAGVHYGADGFVEQIEGWSFLMAVLPRIDACDSDVATTVLENTQIRTSEDDPRNGRAFSTTFDPEPLSHLRIWDRILVFASAFTPATIATDQAWSRTATTPSSQRSKAPLLASMFNAATSTRCTARAIG